MNDAGHALAEIRRTELEAARRVEEARERSVEIVADAKARARRLVEDGRERGRETARRRLEEAVAGSEREAESIRSRGAAGAESLIGSAEQVMSTLVDEMVEVVLAPPLEQGK